MYPDSGYQHHKDQIAELNLELEKRYLVEDVQMGQSYTGIKLDGCERYVNSVFFDFEEDDFTPVDIYSDPRYNNYMRW
jgi:hypothetical protein